MVNKRKFFYNYLSSDSFALLLNSYIWKLTFLLFENLFSLYGLYEKSFLGLFK